MNVWRVKRSREREQEESRRKAGGGGVRETGEDETVK